MHYMINVLLDGLNSWFCVSLSLYISINTQVKTTNNTKELSSCQLYSRVKSGRNAIRTVAYHRQSADLDIQVYIVTFVEWILRHYASSYIKFIEDVRKNENMK